MLDIVFSDLVLLRTGSNPPVSKRYRKIYSCLVIYILTKTRHVHKHKLNKEAVPNQGSKGIRQWTINLCTFLMMIVTITPSVDYNYWLKRKGTQLN